MLMMVRLSKRSDAFLGGIGHTLDGYRRAIPMKRLSLASDVPLLSAKHSGAQK